MNTTMGELRKHDPALHAKAVAYIGEQGSGFTKDTDTVNDAFDWNNTVEGHDFWLMVHVGQFSKVRKQFPQHFEAFKYGYHVTPIEQGEHGEISKIEEELNELKDAAAQGVTLMELMELSDLIGAVESYLNKHHSSVSVQDLIDMSRVKQRAFDNGVK